MSPNVNTRPDTVDQWQLILNGCKEYPSAQITASKMVDLSMSMGESGGNMQFFANMSKKVLPVLLFAAAVMDEDIRRVKRWMHRINDQATHKEIENILRWRKNAEALDIFLGFLARDQKLRGDIGATIESVLVDVDRRGMYLGASPVAYSAAPALGDPLAAPELANAIRALRLSADSQGAGLLARDARCLIVTDEDEDAVFEIQEKLRYMIEASFHGMSTKELEEDFLITKRPMRAVPVEAIGLSQKDPQETILDMITTRRKQLPILVCIMPSVQADKASWVRSRVEYLCEKVAAMDEKDLRIAPVFIVDLTRQNETLEDPTDTLAITHLLLKDRIVSAEGYRGVDWDEAGFWLEDRNRPIPPKPIKASIIEDEDDSKEGDLNAEQILESLQLVEYRLSEKGGEEIGFRKGASIAVEMLVSRLLPEECRSGSLTPLILVDPKGDEIQLTKRHQPSHNAAKMMKTAKAVAWARVDKKSAPAAVKEALQSWTAQEAPYSSQVGEVVIFDFDLGEYFVDDDAPSRAWAIVPTGVGIRI